jgi:hypothetical protein
VVIVEPLGAGGRLPAAARALGARVSAMALDRGEIRIADACRSQLDELIRVDVGDEAGALWQLMRLHASHPVTAVIPGDEPFAPLAHRLAAQLGLPANDFAVESPAPVQGLVDGRDLTIDTVSFGHDPELVHVTDELVTGNPLPGPTGEWACSLATEVLRAFGLRVGPAHIELRLRPDGEPVLVEVAARLADGRILDLIELATGVDMVRETVRSFLGATAPEHPRSQQRVGRASISNGG